MNKKSVVIYSSLITLVALSVLVSAQSSSFLYGFQNFWQGVIDFLNILLSPIFGTSAIAGFTSGEVLFMKALLFAIVLAIVWGILEMLPVFEENKWAVVVISIAVSILSTRFLATPGWIETIFLPYSVLGITLTSLIPLVIYFYFVQRTMGSSPTLRKVSWIFAAVVFVGLFISRVDSIAQNVSSTQFNPAWVYLITAGISLAFLLADKTIRRAFVDSEMHALGAADRTALSTELRRKIHQARLDLAAGLITPAEHKKMEKEFTKRLRAVESY